MSNPGGVQPDIAGAVTPSGTNQAGAALPGTDEAAKLRQEVEEMKVNMKAFQSSKDRETASERRAREAAEARAAQLEQQLAAQAQAQFDEWKKTAEPEEIAKREKLKAEQEAYAHWQRSEANRFAAWKYRTAAELGAPVADFDAMQSTADVEAYRARKLAERDARKQYDEELAKIKAEQAKVAAIEARPRTPLDPGARPAAVTASQLDEVEKARDMYNQGRMKRTDYLKILERYSS